MGLVFGPSLMVFLVNICKQCTFHGNNSSLNKHIFKWGNTLAHYRRVLVHRNNHSTLSKYYVHLVTCMHAVKKGRRLEKKILGIKKQGI